MSEIFDLTVIGGGISGLAVANFAAANGLKVILLEKNSIGSETSAKSMRIIHGGFRYLQNLDIPRVLLSIKDQRRVSTEFPSISKSLSCIMPLKRYGLRSKFPLIFALGFYSFLSRIIGAGPRSGAVLSCAEVKEIFPFATEHFKYGGFMWEDLLLLDPQKHMSEISNKSIKCGAVIKENFPVISVKRRDKFYVTSSINSEEVISRTVVNAAGPWINIIDTNEINLPNKINIRWCLGFNLILKRNLTGNRALALESKQGRLYFIAPRDGVSVLGTGYIPIDAVSDNIKVPDDVIKRFFEEASSLLPDLRLNKEDILEVECGVLPCEAKPDLELCGTYKITSSDGYYELLSTKYTTYYSQAEKLVFDLKKYVQKLQKST